MGEAPRSHKKERCPIQPTRLGSARITPGGAFPVASVGTWIVEYTVGRYGIDDGGAILICWPTADDGSEPQLDDPAATGYVTVCSTGDVRLLVRFQTDYWVRPWDRALIVKVRDGSLAEGDHITITLGDTSAGSPGWRLQSFPDRRRTFAVLVDAFGTKEFYWLPEEPHIEVVPGPAASVEVVLPSTATAGEEVAGRVRVRDSFGNPVRGPCGRAKIRSDGPGAAGLPAEVDVQVGVASFGPVRFAEPGVRRLRVRLGEMTGESNPAEVRRAEAGGHQLFWADMHGQTRETVGTGTVSEYFQFARDRALIDVCAWQGNDFQVTDDLWREVQEETAAFHQPGRFITYLGYEWSGLTPAGGDHNVIYLNDGEPIHRSSHWQVHDGSDASGDRYPIPELWREFRGRDDVLIISHVGGRHANLALADGEFPHLVEVHSHHGTFEWIADEAMRRGLTVGFVAQSDDHTGRPGLSAPLYPVARGFVTFDTPGGYTGVWAPELTREAVWRALKARHCFGTTGRRTILEFGAGEAMMGDVLPWQAETPLEFSARALADGAAIMDFEIRRGTEVAYRHRWPEDERSPWIRIQWSGVRVRSRVKNTDWDGRIAADGGRIEDFRPYALDQPGQGVRRVSDTELAVVSATSGDIDGVLLRVSDLRTRLTFESGPATVSVTAVEITPQPRVFRAGGVNQEVLVSRIDPDARERKIDVAWSDVPPASGRQAYWVRLVQTDGGMAWSSPIFVDTRG